MTCAVSDFSTNDNMDLEQSQPNEELGGDSESDDKVSVAYS